MSDEVLDDETTDDAPAEAEAKHVPYKESDDHVPNPLYQTGHVDTTGTSGDLAGRIEEVSPVFAQARAAVLRSAVDALEAGGSAENVILPDKDKSYEDAIDELKAAADEAEDAPQLTTGRTPAQEEAAQEGEPVNPNAIANPEHDIEDEGPTAPSLTNDIPNPDALVSAETGVPNVNPNAESLDAAEDGAVLTEVVAPGDPEAEDDSESAVPEA